MGRKTEKVTLYEPQADGQGGTVNAERGIFEIESAGGTDVLDVFQILSRTLIPAIKSVAPLLAQLLKDELASKKTATVGIPIGPGEIGRKLFSKLLATADIEGTIEGVLDVASTFMERATRQDWRDTVDMLLLRGTIHVTYTRNKERFREQMDRAFFDDFFAGDLPGILKLLTAALRVNYGNFFGALGGSLAPKPAAGGPSSSVTSPTSPGPSTASS